MKQRHPGAPKVRLCRPKGPSPLQAEGAKEGGSRAAAQGGVSLQGLSSTSSMVGMTARRAGKPIVPMPGVTSSVPAGVL